MKPARNLALILVCGTLVFSAYGQNGQKKTKAKKDPANTGDSVAPDKVLYERALLEIKHNKYDVARLQLQALLNTYPDSEYLAKAKLAVADSYFKEGGSGNLTLAIDEYKSFITFFPFLDEAAYAQMQIAMTHYRRLDKPDRDRTEAELAEQEFQVFLQKYPNSPLTAASEQHLRDVQEALAEGDFRIASYYDMKKSYKAALSRFTDLSNRYPLYSKSDMVLLRLGDLWEKAPLNATSDQKEQLELARKQLAGSYYARIVKDYPLSPLVPKAKAKLTDMGIAIPQPDPTALARMQKEQEMPRERPKMMSHMTGMLHSSPDISKAARIGAPNMNPPDDNSSNGEDMLKPATGGLNVAAGETGATGTPAAGGATTGAAGTTAGDAGATTTGSNAGMQVLSTSETVPTTPLTTGAATPPPTPPGTTSTAPATPPATTPATPPGNAGGASGEVARPGTSSSSSQPTPPAAGTPQGAAQTPAAKPCGSSDAKKDPSSKDKKSDCTPDKESSSRKKGIKKIIPW